MYIYIVKINLRNLKNVMTQKVKLEREGTLEKRRWYRKLCCFFKIFRNQSAEHLFNIFLLLGDHTTQEMLIIFLSSKENIIFL